MPSVTLLLSQLPFPVSVWKQKALAWAAERNELVAYYEPNQISYRHGAFVNMLGVRRHKSEEDVTSWKKLQKRLQEEGSFPLLGFLTYDLKNGIEDLQSYHPDFVGFPEMYFFRPEVWLVWTEDTVTIHSQSEDPADIAGVIQATPFSGHFSEKRVETQPRITQEEYLQTVEQLRQHILEGDVYEVNYCQEFYAENARLYPLPLFWKLNQASPTPFAGFLKVEDHFLLCASPERFLKKKDNLLISQPIKGTIRRGATPEEDERKRDLLASSEKEQAENMMIVDLVRNDLNRVAITGTVQVEELFGLYGFRYVWQMISTVIGQVSDSISSVEVLKATFPMGSMTGAPKIRALELIEKYEKTKRGLYSGSFGYFLPNGDFDFNVVIRSLQYNAQTGYLSFEVGSAITYDSDPEQEYQECLLKAAAITKVLQNIGG
ncbi:anthranilate synthase component I family protein [Rufibacter latericius]|uniref:Anthranilate synthase component I family protein n=1 Tax=Rufibacter latericius TaxID=2487040 RepID=A0A3M9MY97_9BACT|nr:anthranilate synthase component I family protein [Rufibacter latericius]RNI30522.1 anthranilate synthase component I family protein [Rufibacter latericius]